MNRITELVSFALAALFFLYAGISPAFEGRPLNAVLLGLAVLSVILFIAILKKANRDSRSQRQ